MRRPGVIAACLLLAAGAATGDAAAKVLLTLDQAIEAAFPPPARVERRMLYLSDEQAGRAAAAAEAPVEGRAIPYYVGTKDGQVTGFAYFDTHLVRTLPETILVLIAPDGTLKRIDILSFDEPGDYLPPARWLDQFPGRSLPQIGTRQGIHALSGATLSARAITQAARRVLALHKLFVAVPPGP